MHPPATIQGGEPVWFGCDVGTMMSNDYAFWDAGPCDLPLVYDTAFDTAFDLDKAARLAYHETAMTHAMLFTGLQGALGECREPTFAEMRRAMGRISSGIAG